MRRANGDDEVVQDDVKEEDAAEREEKKNKRTDTWRGCLREEREETAEGEW